MERKSFIKKTIAIFVVVVIAAIIVSIILRYDVEGEQNLPFQISKVMLISTASGISNDTKENKWDLSIVQNSDIYIDVIKNKNYLKEEIIDKISINNIKIEEEPKKGKIKFYRPSSNLSILNSKIEYEIENELTYIGSETSDLENLKIANQGGLIVLKSVNTELGNYISNEDEQIRHDGTLLSKIEVKNEEITYKISFDISIELKSERKYKATIMLEIPNGNLIENGTTNYELKGNDIVFKRY